jgi:hypothetical protein
MEKKALGHVHFHEAGNDRYTKKIIINIIFIKPDRIKRLLGCQPLNATAGGEGSGGAAGARAPYCCHHHGCPPGPLVWR